MDIDAFIFDFDGTLYDFKSLPRRLILSHPLDCLKMKKEREVRHKLKGCDFGTEEKFWEEYASALSEKNGKAMLAWYKEKYLPAMVAVLKKHYRCRPNLNEFFAELKAHGKKIVVFSDYGMTKERMKAVGIDEKTLSLCDGIYSATDFGCLKPAVRPFREIAENIGVPCEKCLVIGDRADTDGEGAKSAGMKFLQIKTHKNDGLEFDQLEKVILAKN